MTNDRVPMTKTARRQFGALVIGAWSLVIRRTRAGDGTRTHDLHVGNVSLYQLSYTRNCAVNIGDFPQAVKASSQRRCWPEVRAVAERASPRPVRSRWSVTGRGFAGSDSAIHSLQDSLANCRFAYRRSSSSAMCSTSTARPSRCSRPPMFIRQPASVETTHWAPLARIHRTLSSTRLPEISG